MQTILIHGMGRTRWSMLQLGHRLRRRGHTVLTFGYSVREAFDAIPLRLAGEVRVFVGREPYALVGHSLGGVIARAALPLLEDLPPRRLVMLGTPNRSPRLARRLCRNLFYRALFGDCGQRLADPAFYRALPVPGLPTTLIAGTWGWHGPFSPFGREANDGTVALSEILLRPGDRAVEAATFHGGLIHSARVAWIIGEILAEDFPES